MSSPHTANIFITNNTGGNAYIQMSHQYSDAPVETAAWPAAPGETVGPLVVAFATGFFTGLDYWFCSVSVKDGPAPGIYTSEGSLLFPGKECMLESADADQNITNTVDTGTFSINLDSGGCSTDMNLVGPYAPITNVFVLMLENRSFDHLLGFSGLAGINGLSGTESNYYNGFTYTVSKPALDPMTAGPNHEFIDALEQLCGQGTQNPFPAGPYPPITDSGFVANYATSDDSPPVDYWFSVMACCDTEAQVPALYQLASEFAVCDNWLSSMPGPTWPNRLFAMGGSSSGLDDSPSSDQIKEWESVDGFQYVYGSIFNSLSNNNLRYRLYNDDDDQFAANPSPWYDGGGFAVVSGLKGIQHWDVNNFENFAGDLQGRYPYQFTWIEPNYGDASGTFEGGSSQHPMDSLAAGDAMIAATYNAIRASPLWDTSLLIITYDEHGGFYDHVKPGPAPPPEDDPDYGWNTQGFDFKQFGVRVPAVIVSPLIAKGAVDPIQHDHTSILKTLQALYHLPSLTNRDLMATGVNGLLTLIGSPRTDCPQTITGAAPPPPAPRSMSMDEALSDPTPLPEKGNVIGHLYVALKTDVELSGGDDASKAAAIARVDAIKTRGQLRAYFAEVKAKVEARKALLLKPDEPVEPVTEM